MCCLYCVLNQSQDKPATSTGGVAGPLNSLGADTLGVLYRAATGKVDPWTKNELVACQTQSNVNAGMCETQAAAQATSDVQKTLQLNKSCPCNCAFSFTDWWNNTKDSLGLSSLSDTLIILIAAIFVLGLIYLFKK